MDRERLKAAWARTHAKMNDLRARMRWPQGWPRIPRWVAITGGLAIALALIVAFWDWNILKGPIQRYASSATGRAVTIDGDVDVDFGWSSRITVDRVSIANPDWAQGDMARIGRVRFDVQLLPFLLYGSAILPLVEIDRPTLDLVREKGGRANWRFGEKGDGGDIQLPVIGRMLITNGRVHVNDMKHAMVFDGTVESREGPAGEAWRAFVLRGSGTLDRKPFVASMTGDSPVRADRTHPYAFEARVEMGTSRLVASGALPRPFDLDSVIGTLEITGPDMADLYYVTGLAFPNTPHYRLRGRLFRSGDLWRIADLSGAVGTTDVIGSMSVDDTSARPFLTADLVSRKADIDDIAAVFGARGPRAHVAAAPARAASGTVTVAQAEQPSAFAGTLSLLPDAPLDVTRVRRMDARVKYRVATIATGGVPMRELSVAVKLDHGVLTADPMSVRLALGKLTGRARMDARHAIPDVDVNLRLTDARLEQFFAMGRGANKPLVGEIEARVALHGRGLSVHRAVSNASGNIVLSVPRGEIRRSVAELLGINIVNGLGLMLADDNSRTELRCAVADFEARNGTLRVRRFVVDTDVVLAVGTGRADLRNETIALRVEGHPKKFRIGRVATPITIQGKMANPKIGIEAGKAVAQLGAAGALGVLLTPVAAIIPLISTGSTKDVDCARLLAGGSVAEVSN